MKNKFVMIAFIAMSLVACDNDEQNSLDQPKPESTVSAVMVKDGKIVSTQTRASENMGTVALKFKDEASLVSFKEYLSNETDAEKQKTLMSYGVRTLHDLAEQADDELEKIGEEASSEEQFRSLYNVYKAKYNGLLISNRHDSTDLTLYVPDEDNVESYIANNEGVYVVGNTVVKANLNNDVSTSVIKMSKAFMSDNIPTNSSVFKPNKYKKVYLDAYMINTKMGVRMHCKKKMWYGWKNDLDRAYYLVTRLKNITYLAQGKYEQEVSKSLLPMFIFDNHKKVQNGFNIILGKVNGDRITGSLYAWTDLTIDRDPKGNIIMVQEGERTHPKGSVEKAQIVNINLAPNL